MISMMLQKRKNGELDKFADTQILKMSARITSLWAESLSGHIAKTQLSGQVLNVATGETRSSMGFYRYKSGVHKNRKASFAVRPGKNVNGHLNYLGGMQRGMLAGRGRKVLIRPKPFMRPGFLSWRATGEPKRIKEAVYQAYLKYNFPPGGLTP